MNSWRKITISSFEEQEEDMRRYWASINPEQRMRHLYEMICALYALEEGQSTDRFINNKIHIISSDELFS
jgi:hypothetical protein